MLDPETLYIVSNLDGTKFYGRTPDGEGMYWYDENQAEDALNDVCVVTSVRRFDTPREFDDFRYGYMR